MHDYSKLGLICGIEIHQQLAGKKLFCACPAEIRDDEPTCEIKRKLHAVAGELGNIDPAALHEMLRDKSFTYRFHPDSSCLVELDEEPPHPINKDALKVALEMVLLLNATPAAECQVMRKTVIDGSNTSGFQRTMLVGTDGYVKLGEKRINIPSICLEEDAAKIIERGGKESIFCLDRLGIPLIELGTDPDITSPAEAREVAEKLGMLLRATGKVRRGLGTIRQDVNVSINGGTRVEIKGVQALNDIPGLIENEISRQLALLEIRGELKARGFKEFKPDVSKCTQLFKDCESKIVKGKTIFGAIIPKFKGLIGKELMPDYRFGTELAGIARDAAGLRGIFHSDELPAYGVSQKEVDSVVKFLKPGNKDAFILLACDEKRAEIVFERIASRCNFALFGVPKEVRRADGTITKFMRPLPGSARMYPETDEPLVPITKELLASIKVSKTPEEEEKELIKLGLSKDITGQLIHSRVLSDFKELAKAYGKDVKLSFIASCVLASPDNVDVAEVLSLVASGEITKDSVTDILEIMSKENISAKEAADKLGLVMLEKEEIKRIISEIAKKNAGAPFGKIMGEAMRELRGKADPALVKSILEEVLS